MRVIPVQIERLPRFDTRPSTCTGCHHGDKREQFVYSRAPHAPLQILLTIADMFEPARCALCAALPTPLGEFQILLGRRPQFRACDNSIAVRRRPLARNLTLAVLELNDGRLGAIKRFARLLWPGGIAYI